MLLPLVDCANISLAAKSCASISLPLDELVSNTKALPFTFISLPLEDSQLTFSYSKSVLIVLPLLDFTFKLVPLKVLLNE